jgi:hypothetical protein
MAETLRFAQGLPWELEGSRPWMSLRDIASPLGAPRAPGRAVRGLTG